MEQQTKQLLYQFSIIVCEEFFVEIDGIRYPKDAVHVIYATNDYVDHYRDPKISFEKYAKKPTFKPFRKLNRCEKTFSCTSH